MDSFSTAIMNFTSCIQNPNCKDPNPTMALDIPPHWQVSNDPSQIATSRFIEQKIISGKRYITKKALIKYFEKRWPWAASVITLKVCSLTPK